MKKILALILTALMVLGLTACGGGGTAATAAPEGGSTEGGSTETVSGGVHVFYYQYSDTYISSVRTALDSALTAAGVSYQDYDANSQQNTQNDQIQTAITNGASLLVVNIVDTGSIDAAQNIVDQASGAGIPVIFFNREVDDSVVQSYDKCVFVGTDAAEAGHMQGQMIGEYLTANYDAVDLNGDGAISYVMFKGQEGNNEAIYRTQYSVEDANTVLEGAGKPALVFYDSSNTNQYLVDQDGNWSATAANNYMTTLLSEYSEDSNNMVEMVICNNDGMAEGAISALQDKGYNNGEGSKIIPVFGVDATDAAKALIAAGNMTGTIKQDAEGMATGIAMIVTNGLAGKDLLDGMDSYNIDSGVNKVRIPYGIYTGE